MIRGAVLGMPEPGEIVAFEIPKWGIPMKSVKGGVKEIEKPGVVLHMRVKVVSI